MQLIINRGTNEIGGSCVELSAPSGQRLILDLGQPITGDMAAADGRRIATEEALAMGLLPAVPGLYRGQEGPRPVAVVLSHFHLDHSGLIHHVHPDVPIHLGRMAVAVWQEVGTLAGMLGLQGLNIHGYAAGQALEIEDFTVKPHLMDHSAFDACGLEVRSGGKCVYYSGDFRRHGRQGGRFDRFIASPPVGVDALLMEGTTLSREATEPLSERGLEAQLVAELRGHDRPAFTQFSPLNLDRLLTFVQVAQRTGRKFFIDAYGARAVEAFRTQGVALPPLGRKAGELGVLLAGEPWLEADPEMKARLLEAASPYKRALAGNSLVLWRKRMAPRIAKQGINLEGAPFYYSQWHGYAPEDAALQAFISTHGLEFRQAHASGHADPDTLRAMVEALRPACLIPIHTLERERYAEAFPGTLIRLTEDGEVVDLATMMPPTIEAPASTSSTKDLHGAEGTGWIGVDLDGTLAHYEGWQGPEHIGAPVLAMMARVQRWLAEGREVRIFTARVTQGKGDEHRCRAAIEAWLEAHGLPALGITNVKDHLMIEIWDDRAVQVLPNTGEALEDGLWLKTIGCLRGQPTPSCSAPSSVPNFRIPLFLQYFSLYVQERSEPLFCPLKGSRGRGKFLVHQEPLRNTWGVPQPFPMHLSESPLGHPPHFQTPW